MIQRILLLLMLIAAGGEAIAQSAGFNTTYIVLSINNSSNLYYDLNANTGNYDFNDAQLGAFCAGNTNALIFKGAEHNVFKCNGCDLTSTRLYYRIYQTGTSGGSFVSNALNYFSENSSGGCVNQRWQKLDFNTNLLAGLSAGNYTFEVYSDASITCQGGTAFASNNGANYKAYFTVDAQTVGGTVSSAQTICTGTAPANLTLAGHTGSVVKWQRSTSADFTSGVTDIANTSTTLTSAQIGSLTQTTYFRAVVKSGVCSEQNSSSVAITVNPQTVGGTLSSGFTFCTTSNSGTFTLTGHTGSIIRWESSPVADFSSAVTQITNTTASYNFSNVTQTTYYRAVVQSGVCSVQYSTVRSVIINPNTWTGAVDNDWSNPGNWCGGVPSDDDDVVVDENTVLPMIADGVTAEAGSITVLSNAGITIESGGNLIVTNAVDIEEGGEFIIHDNANLIQVNDVANTGTAQVTKNSSPLYRLDYTIWSAPVEGQNLLDFSPMTVPTRFYSYSENLDIYTGLNPAVTDFEPGYGYLIRMPNNHPPFVSSETPGVQWAGNFTGTLNNGEITVPVANTANGFNMVGNPYPSPINIHDFYTENTGIIEPGSALYFFRKRNDTSATTSTYATVTMAAYVANTAPGGDTGSDTFTGNPANWVINPGQGFFVKVDSSPLVFNNSMRAIANNGQFFRVAQNNESETISRLWLNFTGVNGEFSQAAIAYNAQTTTGIDYGWDGRSANDGPIALYTTAMGENLSVQARGEFNADDVVPVGFSVLQPGEYTIELNSLDGAFTNIDEIYLKDLEQQQVVNLKESSYTFTAGAGQVNDRFEILFSLSALDNTLFASSENKVVLYQNGGAITIDAFNTQLSAVKIFDIHGREIFQRNNIDSGKTTITGLRQQNQMLIVTITTDKGSVVKKIIH
ncbi:T9SS sorting signal type C domain-containing protein [Flavobacterium sp.]|uniref:T9SS sorting signal type C domain-containing protein n=1 Tax=Flavobacterium sp. TaxID=239 RepID=UPI00262986ED|nr:T9SS sorting signal type C domain-containing protein [Flavobacterium sp.]